MYIYIRATAEESLYVVGFYNPSGDFVPESDHSTKGSASARVHYLNGGEKERP
jgi:hypothetical protein